MKSKVIASALTQTIILMGTSAIALLSVEGVSMLSDVDQASWFIVLFGGAVAFAKDVHSNFGEPNDKV